MLFQASWLVGAPHFSFANVNLIWKDAPQARDFVGNLTRYNEPCPKFLSRTGSNMKNLDHMLKYGKRCQKCQILDWHLQFWWRCQKRVLEAKRCQTGTVGCQMATLVASFFLFLFLSLAFEPVEESENLKPLGYFAPSAALWSVERLGLLRSTTCFNRWRHSYVQEDFKPVLLLNK